MVSTHHPVHGMNRLPRAQPTRALKRDIEAADALNLIPTRDEEFVLIKTITNNDYRNLYLVSS
jgi:hypothetical protein